MAWFMLLSVKSVSTTKIFQGLLLHRVIYITESYPDSQMVVFVHIGPVLLVYCQMENLR